MRRTALIVVSLLIFASNAFAKDEYVSITGTVNNFRTDVRILNPSFEKDIVVNATFLPVGNVDNNARQSVAINIPKRQQKVLDDVVTALFNTTGLGAIRFSSADDFEVTSRIYAALASGTLGQFAPGLEPGAARTKGALLQLRSNASFRTNIGAVNAANANTTVIWRLYDKNNAIVATGSPIVMPAYAVIGPTNMATTFFFNPGTADLSDAWVSYTATNPIFAYASVIDNVTTDPTLILAAPDTGTASGTTSPTAKTFDVTLRSFSIAFSPEPVGLKVGDTVTVHIHGNDTTHGFSVVSPTNKILVEGFFINPGTNADRSFTITEEGTFTYFCVNPVCGEGHGNMVGTFKVGAATGDDDPGRGY